jgi:hypothetical protein
MAADITKVRGEILAFDEPNRKGTVRVGLELHPFWSTSFSSGPPWRWPKTGEPVDVLFNQDGELLAVRAVNK